MTTNKDLYIKALEYAESKQSFNLDELANHLELKLPEKQLIAEQIHYKQIFHHDHTDYINNFKSDEEKSNTPKNSSNLPLSFSIEDKFRLINYRSLEEARASSRQSTCFASFALVISIITALVSIYYANKQLESEINIPKKISSEIENISQKQSIISSTLILLKKNGLNLASSPENK